MNAMQGGTCGAASPYGPIRLAGALAILLTTLVAMPQAGLASGSKPPSSIEAETGDTPIVNPAQPSGSTSGGCDAEAARSLVGSRPDDGVLQTIRRTSGAADVRVLPEGSNVTREYRDDRINVHLDASGRIVAIECG